MYKAHVFVCTNQKPPGKACCADKNGGALRQELKNWAKERFGREVRINASGCLDRCAEGIACVIYPQGEWHVGLGTDSIDVLKARIEELVKKSN